MTTPSLPRKPECALSGPSTGMQRVRLARDQQHRTTYLAPSLQAQKSLLISAAARCSIANVTSAALSPPSSASANTLNPHRARGIRAYLPRVPSLEDFGRRPRCKRPHPDGAVIRNPSQGAYVMVGVGPRAAHCSIRQRVCGCQHRSLSALQLSQVRSRLGCCQS